MMEIFELTNLERLVFEMSIKGKSYREIKNLLQKQQLNYTQEEIEVNHEEARKKIMKVMTLDEKGYATPLAVLLKDDEPELLEELRKKGVYTLQELLICSESILDENYRPKICSLKEKYRGFSNRRPILNENW